MEIFQKAQLHDLRQLAQLYKKTFKKHNIFTKPEPEVLKYLEKNIDNLMIGKEHGKIIAGALISFDKNGQGHSLWRLKHLAIVKDKQGSDIGSKIVKAMDEMIAGMIKGNEIKSAKIEVHVSENEKKALPFYLKNGFEIEGKLKDHYRKGELCYILGKVSN